MITHRATVAELHGVDPFAGRRLASPEVRLCEPVDAALVLGSGQGPDLVDPAACTAAGLGVVRRRSGGGLVVVHPGDTVWIDVVVPHGVAPDDVRGSMVWVGERWAAALDGLVPGRRDVHRGGMVASPWSGLVCFAGIGPGEVLLDGLKFVGLSQRRTRDGLRFQGMFHRRSWSAVVPTLLAVPGPASPLGDPAVAPGLDARTVATRLLGALHD